MITLKEEVWFLDQMRKYRISDSFKHRQLIEGYRINFVYENIAIIIVLKSISGQITKQVNKDLISQGYQVLWVSAFNSDFKKILNKYNNLKNCIPKKDLDKTEVKKKKKGKSKKEYFRKFAQCPDCKNTVKRNETKLVCSPKLKRICQECYNKFAGQFLGTVKKPMKCE